MKKLDITLAMAKRKLAAKSGSLDEVTCTNVVQYLTAKQRIALANEICRVLKPKGTAQVIFPHWCAAKYCGDLDVTWPPVTEAWFYRLNKEWRKANKVSGYKCDFDFTLGYGMHPAIVPRSQEHQHNALSFWKEAAQDTIANLTKRA